MLREKGIDFLLKAQKIRIWRYYVDYEATLRENTTQRRIDAVGYEQEYLRKPFYRRFYDFPGVFGQYLSHRITPGLRVVNCPYRRYCSEHVAEVMRIIDPSCDLLRPTPGEINDYCEQSPRWNIIDLEQLTERLWFAPIAEIQAAKVEEYDVAAI